MKKFAIVALISFGLLAFSLQAEEASTAGGAAAQEQAASSAEGCMPNGGCCGACVAARAQAKAQEGQKHHEGQVGQDEKPSGCPCKQAKQQSM
ncbi:hypothetical protein HRbin30_00030 [bacterium HR30]|nr:hypothetical protein HRbin30_00030 [bacterium HR30]